MKKRIAIIFVALAVILSACGAKAVEMQVDQRSSDAIGGAAPLPQVVTEAPALDYETMKAEEYAVSNTSSGYEAQLHNRMIVTNVDLTIVVSNPQKKMDAIAQLAASMGGWVVSMNMYRTYLSSGETAPEGYISIRVPAEKLEPALTQLKADAVEVRSENRSGQDVTAQYTDLQSQLTNLEMAEKDLQAIMEEAKNNPNSNTTSKTQDVLSVYNQIVSVRGQIEQIKGQMKYYKESSDTSLINVTLIAEETVKPIEIAGWKPGVVASDAIRNLLSFLEGFVDFMIRFFLYYLWVLLIIFGPIALVIWGIVAAVRRSKAKKAQKAIQAK